MIIQIGQTKWTVEHTDLEDEFGITDHFQAKILVKKDQTKDQLRDTLLHEVLHAICFNYGVSTKDEETEEAILKTLTPVLLDVLCRNPKLVTFLLNKE